jgi:glycosyltransferase involved in cell wall biosynthesis
MGDAGLVISKVGVGANSVPSKTWSIMAAARPVIASFGDDELHAMIEQNGCGIYTPAGDKTAFKKAVLRLYEDRELCQQMGRNGRQFVMEHLTKEVGTKKYVDIIKKLFDDDK